MPKDEYVLDGFTREEIILLRQLVTDRIEARFAYAAKMADGMDLIGLSNTTKQLEELSVLKEKLKGDL